MKLLHSFTLASVFLMGLASAQPLPCATCHPREAQSLQAGPHAPNQSDCGACHGQTQEHAQKMGGVPVQQRFGKDVPTAQRDGPCLQCHQDARALMHWDTGAHKKADVACVSCHSVHKEQSKTLDPSISAWVNTTRRPQYEACVGCHQPIRAQINKVSHHPLVEGKLACTDCHNPHGSLSPNLLKEDTPSTLCLSCHAEKRGPFVWPHPPVEENCLACHSPHGSNHAKLLSEKLPNLCQDCHDGVRHPGNYYGANQGFAPGAQSTRFVARACVNCHQAVHGSNAPGARGKFFTR